MGTLSRFWQNFVRRYASWYALGLVCLVSTNVLTVTVPDLVKRTVDALDQGRGLDGAAPFAWGIIGAGLGIMVVRTLSRTLFFNPGRAVEFRVKQALFDRVLELPATFFEQYSTGEIISRGTNDTGAVRSLAGFASLQFFNVTLMLALTLGKMLTLSVELTLLCALPLAFAAAILRLGIKRLFRLSKLAQETIALLSTRILETYNGMGMLRSYNATTAATERFTTINRELREIGMGLVLIRSWLLPIISVVGSLCTVLLLVVGGQFVIEGKLTIGSIAAFAVYIGILVTGLTSLGWMVNAMQRGWIGLQRVDEILISELGRPRTSEHALKPSGPTGANITVDQLQFTYGASQSERGAVIDGLDLHIASGEVLGVFGLTGAGKSTLLDLIARVREPGEDTIYFDGQDISTIDVQAHWRRLAYVTQRPFLFSRSVRANITWTPDGEDIDETALQQAIQDAALDHDLTLLGSGIDTVVGERGITLSGGQRQRVALARAFYRDYELLLLDDVLSAVDHATEKRLIDAIYRRTATQDGTPRTAIIVSHRISVLSRADRIIVIENGRVVDEGSHAQLSEATDSVYAKAWRLQRDLATLESEGAGG